MGIDANSLPELHQIALGQAPAGMRTNWLSLFALDQRLGRILAETTEPMLAQIKLAWWRDRLSEPIAKRPTGDAVLDGLSSWEGHEAALVDLINSWEALLEEELSAEEVSAYLDGRASPFTQLAEMSGAADPAEASTAAAKVWALSDLIAHISSEEERALILAEFSDLAVDPVPALPKPMRPLSILSALAKRHLNDPSKPILSRRRDALITLRVGIFGK